MADKKRPVEIVAYHGWGMKAEFWNKWDELIGDHVTLKKNDRGYFYKPTLNHFENPNSYKVLFVEGFGMHWVAKEDWENAHIIVLFSAFKNLKDIMKMSRNVDHVVNSLQLELQKQVYTTLEKFWKQLFRTDDFDFIKSKQIENADRQLLINDLEVYYGDIVSSIPVRKNAKVLLYETQFDEIMVHPQKNNIRSLFGKLHYYKSLDLIGHAFPFSHAKTCYDDLNGVLKIL